METNTTPHATPAQLRLLELQHEEIRLNAAKIQGLFQFLNFSDPIAFDRCLGRSGKSPDCLSRAPDGGPAHRKYANITGAGQGRKMRLQAASRSAMLVTQRKEPAALSSEETIARLKHVFLAYTDPMLYAQTGRRQMNIVGFCRLLRDCRLLDNRLTLVAADVIFTRVDTGTAADVEGDGACGGGGGGGSGIKDLYVDYEGFLRCLRGIVHVKFPQAADAQEALLLLVRKWVLPFARDSGGGALGTTVDGLFSRSTMNLIRKYDSQLKKLFAWYSSMDETDPGRVDWSWVREHGGSINSSQFALMLLNFCVLPALVPKSTALGVFAHCEAANDGDERANAMYFPAFLETLAEVALEVGKEAVARIRATTSPDELKLLRRYAEGCPEPYGPQVMQVYKEALAARGRDASSLDQLALYDAASIRRKNEEQMAEALQQQAEARMHGVVQRREGLRQRLALTRLRNFYRDVRTFNNNSTWPPERDMSPATRHRSHHKPDPGADSSVDGNGEVHVAFYDSERAIKTPKPEWIPVGHGGVRRFSHMGPEATSQSGAPIATAASMSAPQPGHPGSAAANYLLLDSPSGAATKQSIFSNHSVAAGGGVNGNGYGRPSGLHVAAALLPPSSAAYGRSPKPYQLKVAIEDRDEHEAILDLASRLPYICVNSSSGGAATQGAVGSQAALGALGLALVPSWAAPCHGKPRAVTAPAEVNRRWRESESSPPPGPQARSPCMSQPSPEEGPDGAGAAPPLGRVDCGADLGGTGTSSSSVSKPRLPPVQHQLHRAQATAAALAVMAGAPVPNPYQSGSAALHLPPALNRAPSLSSSGYFCHPSGGEPPSPQYSSLSLGTFSPNTSQQFSPHSSLTRCRKNQSQRKRVDAGGLPNLNLPADTGPSVEVAAALDELDRFDNARNIVARGRRQVAAESGGQQ